MRMRIISGKYKRRKLLSPPDGAITRPFPDMVKEAMFNLLRGHFEGEAVLDCFSGTGTVGLEAASRGASQVVCIERDRRVTRVLEQNIEMLGAEETVEVVTGDALGPTAIHRCPKPVHIIFYDPPYAMVWDPEDWVRVRTQFERLIQQLDDTGYAVLRTPWPLFHKDTTEEVQSHTKKAPAPIEMVDGEEMIEIDLNDPEADDMMDAFEKDLAREASKPKFQTIDIDLSMNGALGPETHEYGGMALHLYMRDPDAS
ncbi:MAG: RsmD family RNA methyltransferase [Phycisphaerales bacterium]|nr:RsmD family RNA methyltransferase [Phycisphaerales bacterium]